MLNVVNLQSISKNTRFDYRLYKENCLRIASFVRVFAYNLVFEIRVI